MANSIFPFMDKPNWTRAQSLVYSILILALLISGLIALNRIWVEFNNRQVEMVWDYNDLMVLSAYTGKEIEALLPILAEAGITSIALGEDNMPDLEKQGRASWVSGQEIINNSRLAQLGNYILREATFQRHVQPGFNYLVIDEEDSYQRAFNALVNEFGEDRVHELGGNVIEVQAARDELSRVGFGVSPRIYENLTQSGFAVVPKILDSKRLNDVALTNKIRAISRLKGVRTVLFIGRSVLGSGNNLQLVADGLRESNLNMGILEFVQQEGKTALAEIQPEKTLLVHVVSQEEMQNIKENRLVNRYALAVSERGTRMLLLKPLLDIESQKNILAVNKNYIMRVRTLLENQGYHIKPVDQPAVSGLRRLSGIEIYLLGLGSLVSVFLLWQIFKPLELKPIYITLGTWTVVFVFCLLTGRLLALRKMSTLLVMIVFPVLAMIRAGSLTTTIPALTGLKERYQAVLPVLAQMLGITAMGALLLTGLMSDPFYMHKIYAVSGVKIAFILPLLLVSAYYFLYPHRIFYWRFLLNRLLSTRLSLGGIVSMVLVFAFVLLYLLRSGNFGLPVMEGESQLRVWLQQFLGVRPRAKEFLFAYPLFMLCWVYLGILIQKQWVWLVMALATIAPISLLNTFSHIHTPLIVSLWRSFNGVFWGLIMAVIFIFVIEAFRKIWKLLAE